MKHHRLSTYMYAPFIVILLATLVVGGSWALHAARREHYAQIRLSLQAAAGMLRETLSQAPQTNEQIDALCKTHGEAAGYRFTVVLNNGLVAGDTLEDPQNMGDHSSRPEIRQLAGESNGAVGWSERRSGTVGATMMYVAIPWQGDAGRIGYVRAARAMSDIDQAIGRKRIRFASIGLVLAILGSLISGLMARRLSTPLDAIRQRVEAYTNGKTGLHLPSSPILEVHTLTEAMNTMASHLVERIETIVRQRDEQNALLSCMTEAVLAVDDQGRILSMNPAATALFEPDSEHVAGRLLQEVIRNADVQRLWRKTLESSKPVEEDFLIPDSNRSLQAHGTALTDGHGHRIGAVLVMNDITRMRRLETMRRDFVANVSHELKTPVTSIKGFAETLLDGAAENPEDRQRFLEIIDKQADRLKSILEDLLALSSLEHNAESGAIPFQKTKMAPLLEQAVKMCRKTADDKGITVAVACDTSLKAEVNAPLLEQAVVNLVGNAVKYGLEKTDISVSAEHKDNTTLIRVADQGPGIARHHLPRIFERFYRVDKGRSRTMGGTGLGLAIVKRVAIAHGGQASVESHVGKGSVFTISLPDHPPQAKPEQGIKIKAG